MNPESGSLASWVIEKFGTVVDIPYVMNEKAELVIAYHELKQRVSDRYGAESVELWELKSKLRIVQAAALGGG